MSTIWTTPSTIIQYAEDESHIPWSSNDFELVKTLNSGVSLSAPLLHISRQPKNDIKMKTWYVKATNFNFTNIPNEITGIQLKLSVIRSGRVFDDTVQLTHNDELLGENLCKKTVNPIQIYGDSLDAWEVNNLADIVSDPSFGVVLRFKSHPDWPHKTTPILRSIELQIY